MTKEIEKLSAWYDGEISQDDFDEGLKSLKNNSKHKKYFINTLFSLS